MSRRARSTSESCEIRWSDAHTSRAPSTSSRACCGPQRGPVTNTASFVAVIGAATSQIFYTASKGEELALSRELGVEFARRDVRAPLD
jgi:NAD(P)-dependent dehydrogenase (short-subunit alcohol dehydrogenase family)